MVQLSHSEHTSIGKGISVLNRSLHTLVYVPILVIAMIDNQTADESIN